jgi:hypothetical protein
MEVTIIAARSQDTAHGTQILEGGTGRAVVLRLLAYIMPARFLFGETSLIEITSVSGRQPTVAFEALLLRG